MARSWLTGVRLAVGLWCAVLLRAAPADPPRAPLPLLTRAHAIQLLSAEEANRRYPIRLRGVITYTEMNAAGLGDLYVQDSSAGIFVFLTRSSSSVPLHAGQIVVVDGVSTPGDFSPCVTGAHVEVLGEGVLPKPKQVPYDERLGAREDGQWIEQEGVVRSGQVKGDRLFLNVAAAGGTFLAIIVDYPGNWASLIDAKIAVTGAVAPVFNDRRQSVGFRLFIPYRSLIRIEEAAPEHPFDLPVMSTVSVDRYHPQGYPDRRIHIRGAVTAIEPGAVTYVSDAQGSVAVQSDPFCDAQPGDLLDVVGFPGSADGRPGLEDAVCRRAAGEAAESPVPVSAGQILPAAIAADTSGYAHSASQKYDARLISVEGKLLQVSEGPDGASLVLEEGGNRTFTATLPRPGALPRLAVGSRILLTGVCLVTYDRYRRGQYFRILLRRPGDIRIKERPPWLDREIAVRALCFLVAAFIGALIWAQSLRVQVARRVEQLRLLSLQDPLTGAANRRCFDEELAAEFQRARRAGSPLSLLMIDIDFFKALNDTVGHQRGDACLLQVVQALQSVCTRSTDLIARYGGEEFAIILPSTGEVGASRVAERVRAGIEQLAIRHPGHPLGGNLSVSIGIGTMIDGDDRCILLVERADRALYRAKTNGRNCVATLHSAAVA